MESRRAQRWKDLHYWFLVACTAESRYGLGEDKERDCWWKVPHRWSLEWDTHLNMQNVFLEKKEGGVRVQPMVSV